MRITHLLSIAVLLLGASTQAIAYDDDHGDGARYDRGRYGQRVLCESIDHRFRICGVDTRGGVWLHQRHSRADCEQGRDWGYDQRGIWVANGCRAEFVIGDGRGRDHERDRHREERPFTLRCDSYSQRANYCRFDDRYDRRYGHRDYDEYRYDRMEYRVRIREQYSRAPCHRGRDWDVDGRGIWVSNGCRALFEVKPRHRDDRRRW